MGEWLAYATRLGVELRPPDEKRGAILLGGGPKEEPFDEVALSLRLSDADVAALTHPAACAATAFGPISQEKSFNEDFAVGAVFETEQGPISFAAVADGISNGVFWPARSSRIAALVALRCAHAFFRKKKLTVDSGAQFIGELTAALKSSLTADRTTLNDSNTRDPDWAPNVYDDFRDDDASWYGTTLLVALVGPDGGFCVHAGDGAIIDVVETHPPTAFTIQETGPSSILTRYVSFQLDARMFTAVPLPPRSTARHVLLASDGLDRTLQRRDGVRSFLKLPDAPARLYEAVARMGNDADAEHDNMSIARASFPVEDSAKSWRAVTEDAANVSILSGEPAPTLRKPKKKSGGGWTALALLALVIALAAGSARFFHLIEF